MTTRGLLLTPVLVLAAAACGGTLETESVDPAPAPADSARPRPPTDSATTTTPPSTTPVSPKQQPPSAECGGWDGVVLEKEAKTLSRLDAKAPSAVALGEVPCADRIDELVLERAGTVLGLDQKGALTRMHVQKDGSPATCQPLPSLPISETSYRGLWIAKVDGADVAHTVRMGSSQEYLTDGAYHHTLLRIDPSSSAVQPIATLDTTAWPEAVHVAQDGRVMMVFRSGLVLWDVTGASPVRTDLPVPQLSYWRGSLPIKGGLFGIGDIHDSTGAELPTYSLSLPSGSATKSGQGIALPGGSIFGFVIGSTACTYE